MKLRVRLNKSGIPARIFPFLPSADDARILIDDKLASEDMLDKAMSGLRFGKTYKATANDRHPKSDDLLIRHLNESHRVYLDVGASNGITSLNLIEKLGETIQQFYITDYNLTVNFLSDGNQVAFEKDGNCILFINKHIVIYPEGIPFLEKYCSRKIQSLNGKKQSLLLLHPKVKELVKQDKRVESYQYSIFDKWPHERPDVVKVANLLHRNYFSDQELEKALINILNLLPDNGLLLLLRNVIGYGEIASLYQKNKDHFKTLEALPDPIDIHEIVQKVSI